MSDGMMGGAAVTGEGGAESRSCRPLKLRFLRASGMSMAGDEQGCGAGELSLVLVGFTRVPLARNTVASSTFIGRSQKGFLGGAVVVRSWDWASDFTQWSGDGLFPDADWTPTELCICIMFVTFFAMSPCDRRQRLCPSLPDST